MNQNGVHRANLWQIAGFALNNTATNLYLFFMNFISNHDSEQSCNSGKK